MFYDKAINIYSYGEYDDEVRPDVVIQREGYKLVKSGFMVDIQPFNSDKAYEEYGYKIECSRKMFSDNIPELQEDCLVEYNSKFYRIVKTLWDDGYYEMLLNETNDFNIIRDGAAYE